jgi:proline iminopeptidase
MVKLFMKIKKKLLLFAGIILLVACKKIDEPGNLVPKTADQDPSIPSIKINDRVLHSEAFGHPDSTMVVCIHGGPSADYRYMLMAKDLINYGYRVVFYDQVGSGLSQRFNESYYDNKNLDEIFLNELKGVINHYKTKANQKVILFGHSWGAIMATAYAGKYASEIHGMALIEPGGLKWDDIVEYIKKAQSTPLWSEMVNDILYQDQFLSTQKDNHEILDYKLTLLASHGSPNTLETITGKDGFWRFGAVINLISFNYGQKHKPDMSEGIQNYNRQILFIHGGAGKVYTSEWAQKIAAVYKNKEIFKVDGVGHSGMLEPLPWNTITLPKLVTYFKSL